MTKLLNRLFEKMRKNRLELIRVSFNQLKAEAINGIYAGSSINIKSRYRDHKSKYKGTMFYVRTENMKRAENILLRNNPPESHHTQSNTDAKRGYVYVIKGKKK